MRVLQTLALPLGYVTIYEKRSLRSDSHFGAGDEARTRYLDLGKVALYQMSYTRIYLPLLATNVIIHDRFEKVKHFFKKI